MLEGRGHYRVKENREGVQNIVGMSETVHSLRRQSSEHKLTRTEVSYHDDRVSLRWQRMVEILSHSQELDSLSIHSKALGHSVVTD